MKFFKQDTEKWTVRVVEGEPWPGKDEEGDECFKNTHFTHEEDAWESLVGEATAWINLASRGVEQARTGLLKANEEAANAAIAFTAAIKNRAEATRAAQE